MVSMAMTKLLSLALQCPQPQGTEQMPGCHYIFTHSSETVLLACKSAVDVERGELASRVGG